MVVSPATTAPAPVASGVLDHGLADFREPAGPDLIARCAALEQWVDASRSCGLFPFIRHHATAPDVTANVIDFGGHRYRGINLASQDYLGLSRHHAVVAGAAAATMQHGTHSAGSEPMGGGLHEATQLARDLGSFIGFDHVVLFPSGWGAGYGGIKGLVRAGDDVVIDVLAHDCLQQGARAATGHVMPFAHNDLASLEKRLALVRRKRSAGAVLVVTESLFSMDSDSPDLRGIVRLCRAFGARLLVDVAHDLGSLGPGGRGVLAEQGALADVDVLVGSFSKTFASIGGFVATRARGASYAIRAFSGTYTFSNYLVPSQVAAVRSALGIIDSDEGQHLRDQALSRARTLRDALTRSGVQTLGRVSPIVLAAVGPEPVARLAQRRCLETGVIVNSVEFPACRRGAARFRLQVGPRHDPAQLEAAARLVGEALAWARSVHHA